MTKQHVRLISSATGFSSEERIEHEWRLDASTEITWIDEHRARLAHTVHVRLRSRVPVLIATALSEVCVQNVTEEPTEIRLMQRILLHTQRDVKTVTEHISASPGVCPPRAIQRFNTNLEFEYVPGARYTYWAGTGPEHPIETVDFSLPANRVSRAVDERAELSVTYTAPTGVSLSRPKEQPRVLCAEDTLRFEQELMLVDDQEPYVLVLTELNPLDTNNTLSHATERRLVPPPVDHATEEREASRKPEVVCVRTTLFDDYVYLLVRSRVSLTRPTEVSSLVLEPRNITCAVASTEPTESSAKCRVVLQVRMDYSVLHADAVAEDASFKFDVPVLLRLFDDAVVHAAAELVEAKPLSEEPTCFDVLMSVFAGSCREQEILLLSYGKCLPGISS